MTSFRNQLSKYLVRPRNLREPERDKENISMTAALTPIPKEPPASSLRSPIASRPCRTAASTSRRSTGDSCFANTHRRRIQGRPRSGDRPRLARRRAQTCSPRARPWNPRSSAAFPEMSFENVRHWLTQLGVLTARPAAFVIFALYGVAWIAIGNGLEWHALATLATWGMTLVIQRAEHRDTQALHAKLDELLKATHRANNDIMRIDDKDAEEVEKDRERVRRRP